MRTPLPSCLPCLWQRDASSRRSKRDLDKRSVQQQERALEQHVEPDLARKVEPKAPMKQGFPKRPDFEFVIISAFYAAVILGCTCAFIHLLFNYAGGKYETGAGSWWVPDTDADGDTDVYDLMNHLDHEHVAAANSTVSTFHCLIKNVSGGAGCFAGDDKTASEESGFRAACLWFFRRVHVFLAQFSQVARVGLRSFMAISGSFLMMGLLTGEFYTFHERVEKDMAEIMYKTQKDFMPQANDIGEFIVSLLLAPVLLIIWMVIVLPIAMLVSFAARAFESFLRMLPAVSASIFVLAVLPTPVCMVIITSLKYTGGIFWMIVTIGMCVLSLRKASPK